MSIEAKYGQYMARFNTTNSSLTPYLLNVTFNAGIFTDSYGNYNYTLTAPSGAGTYPIKVNATFLNIPGEQTQNLIVKAAQTINLAAGGAFIIQNSTGGTLATIDSTGTMNIKGSLTQNQEPTTDANDFAVQNSTGGLNLVITNPEGNMIIKNSLTESQPSLNATLKSFIIQNSTGATVAYVNSTGGLFLTGTLTESVLFE